MSIYEFGPFELRAEELLLIRNGEPVALGRKVVETLLALVEHPGELLAKNVLLDRIWPEGFVEEANLAQNVHILRKTFHHYNSPNPIETVPCRGYRFTMPVRTRSKIEPVPSRGGNLTRTRRIAAVVAAAAAVAASLVFVASLGFGQRTIQGQSTSDMGASSYRIGHYYWNLRTREGVQKSLAYFARAIDADPREARAYAALAAANVTMGEYCYGTHQPAVYFARAQAYAQTALALDSRSAEAHAVIGLLALDRGTIPAALPELRRAIALDPSYGPAHEWYGIALVRSGHVARAMVQLRTAADLDPLSVAAIAWLGSAAYLNGQFADAIAYSREALELSPRRPDVLVTIGKAYEARGDFERAIAAFKQYGDASPYNRAESAALLARAYALAHRNAEARAQFAYARAHAGESHPRHAATYA